MPVDAALQAVGAAPKPVVAAPAVDPLKRLGALGAQREQANAAYGKESEGLQGRIQAEQKAAADIPAPKLENVSGEFQHKGLSGPELTETMQTMFALAAIGGAMTRTPMTAAFNSFSAALKGLTQGDQILFQREKDAFDLHLKTALAKNQQAMNDYKIAFEKHRGNVQDLMNEWSILTKKHGDTLASINAERQDIQGMLRHIESMKKMDEMARASADRTKMMLAALEERHRHDVAGEQFNEAKLRAAAGKGPNANQRAQLVVSSAKNTLNRLDEFLKDKESVPRSSLMFGAHPEGVIDRGAVAIGNTLIGEDQRKVDAAYNSIIDEAIPVFTGGLRGSDSYRRFLISQMPGPGDDDNSAAEKLRLFRSNVEGNLNTFSSAFKSNPAFHAEGEAPGAAGGAIKTTSGITLTPVDH